MITSRAWSGKLYAVLGLARSGVATVEALLAGGAEVVAWDSNSEARDALLNPGEGRGPATQAEHLGPGLRRGELSFADPLTLDLNGFAGVVVSPGVPLNTHPIAAHAKAHNVPVIGDIELFAQARGELPPHKVVGITGTNGKSTTTALLHHIFRTAGVPTTMGGNIGLPILAQQPLTPNDKGAGVYVLELSSYQIDLTRSLDCDIAVLLNVSPDHLDRYNGSLEAYAASKIRLFEMQTPDKVSISFDDIGGENMINLQLPHKEDPATSPERLGTLQKRLAEDHKRWPSLKGAHNYQNARAAANAALALGLDPDAIIAGCRSFAGLPHRLERVRDTGKVLFVNDSKATNPEAAAPALSAFWHVHWILGGRAKAEDLGPCERHLSHVRAAYTIGEAGPAFARLLRDKGVDVVECGTLERAVEAAAATAGRGEVVLLAPACASFDQFRDFEARGDAFRALVEALP